MNGTAKIIHASCFKAKSGEVYTKLFVPIGGDLYPIITKGDCTDSVGRNLPVRLYVNNGELKLGLDNKEV